MARKLEINRDKIKNKIANYKYKEDKDIANNKFNNKLININKNKSNNNGNKNNKTNNKNNRNKVIANILSVSLNDFPGFVSSLVYFQGCNLNCGYCFNYKLIPVTESEYDIYQAMNFIKSNPLINAVTITGGEPLIHFDELYEFIKMIKKSGLKVKLDTNGTFPERLKLLLKERLLDAVAIDIKGDSSIYKMFSRHINIKSSKIKNNSFESNALKRKSNDEKINNYNFNKMLQSISIVKQFKIQLYLRTTLIKELHTDKIIENIFKAIPENESWYLQEYINSDVNSDKYKNYSSYKKNEIVSLLCILQNKYKKNISIYYNFEKVQLENCVSGFI